ncbi:MAG TPA: YceD family protein [Rhizomicrobium sp.]
MTTQPPPFQEIYDLGDLSRGGVDLRISASGEELVRIARWANVEKVESFSATMTLRKHAANSFSLDADLTADIVQGCVVTLEPVRSHVERQVHRALHLTAPIRHRGDASVALTELAGEDDVPEEIDSLDYDLAAPLLEELALAIDPYPRAPGVEFAAPAEAAEAAAKPESPFAVLKSLKNRG